MNPINVGITIAAALIVIVLAMLIPVRKDDDE